MGRTPREQPARLAAKLTDVRKLLNLSQEDMVRRLGLESQLAREEISKYERGLRTPSLLVLLKYARAAGLIVDDLIDDELDLPDELPVSSGGRENQKGTITSGRPRSKAVGTKRT
jgi:transcriptional regulator with XRE-family HTH domain